MVLNETIQQVEIEEMKKKYCLKIKGQNFMTSFYLFFSYKNICLVPQIYQMAGGAQNNKNNLFVRLTQSRKKVEKAK